jgi:hypothetical protein
VGTLILLKVQPSATSLAASGMWLSRKRASWGGSLTSAAFGDRSGTEIGCY